MMRLLLDYSIAMDEILTGNLNPTEAGGLETPRIP